MFLFGDVETKAIFVLLLGATRHAQLDNTERALSAQCVSNRDHYKDI